jgi:hypothetical protein
VRGVSRVAHLGAHRPYARTVKTVVLDANELSRDFMCCGLKYQLLEHMFHATWLTVYVPAVALEELVANHRRAVEKNKAGIVQLDRQRRRLGLSPVAPPSDSFDYRSYITERWDQRLAFNVLPWATVTHQKLVERAVNHLPPFNSKRTGYRDALIWSDVVTLAAEGREVAFVSADGVFGDAAGNLAEILQEDVDRVGGKVELVRDFGAWLLEQLPWQVENLPKAVKISRDAEFYDFYLKSDFQSELAPELSDLGLDQAPYALEIDEVEWDGHFESVSEAAVPPDLTLVEYDIGQTVRFTAVFDREVQPEGDWEVSRLGVGGGWQVAGSVAMVVRSAVLFGGEFGFSIDEVAWRRADGRGPGATIYRPELDLAQLSLDIL